MRKIFPRFLKSGCVPAFYFSTDIGCYTGKLANNLVDFCSKIETVAVESVEFHFARGDFQRWIRECVGASELADRITSISKELEGEELREEIHRMMDKRIKELQKLLASKQIN